MRNARDMKILSKTKKLHDITTWKLNQQYCTNNKLQIVAVNNCMLNFSLMGNISGILKASNFS